MLILEEKIFGQYEVYFPVEQELTLIHGQNGTGKTQTIELLNRYFLNQGENVTYFPFDREFSVTEDQIISCFTIQALQGKSVFKKYGIELNKINFMPLIGDRISSGFIQIINMYCRIILGGKDQVVLIDSPERNLHIGIQRDFIKDLYELNKLKKIIIVTHSPSIVDTYSGNWIDINKCVQLYERY